MSFEEATRRVAATLGAKLYGDRSKLDALVYMNLKTRHIYPAPSDLRFTPPVEQGWRSVTMLSLPYAAVLTASANAPDELRERVGRLYLEPDIYKLEKLFDAQVQGTTVSSSEARL